MSSSDEFEPYPKLHIADLPVEMFQYIISYLPLCDRKSVSLVSRSWSQQAFPFSGMDYVNLRINGFMIEQRDLDVLRKSVRPYRHLVLFFGHRPCSGLDLATVMEILTRLGPNIESFVLTNDCTPRQFKEFVSRMLNLKQISVTIIDRKDQAIDSEKFPILKRLTDFRMKTNILEEPWVDMFRMAPNVCKLSVNLMGRSTNLEQTLKVMKGYGPQLKYLELLTSNMQVPIEKLDLRQLHTLKLWGVTCDRDEELVCRSFENLPVLQTAFLHFSVTSGVLKVICNKCPHLSKLRFKTDELIGKSFSYLEQLKNLRVLLIDNYMRRGLLDDCKPLESVEYFSICKNPIKSGTTMEQLSFVFPKMRTLKVDRSYGMQMDNTFVQEICRNFNQLKCLIIDAVQVCTVGSVEQVSPKIFSLLVELTNLEELTLSCMRLGTTISQHDCLFISFVRTCLGDGWKKRSQSNLKRLKLNNCLWVMGGNLVNVAQLFPRLQYLEVSQCRMITVEDMEFARKTMPNCVIHFVRWERHYGALEKRATGLRFVGNRPNSSASIG